MDSHIADPCECCNKVGLSGSSKLLLRTSSALICLLEHTTIPGLPLTPLRHFVCVNGMVCTSSATMGKGSSTGTTTGSSVLHRTKRRQAAKLSFGSAGVRSTMAGCHHAI